jgi:tetratricopeptide (TPR) repeat protein
MKTNRIIAIFFFLAVLINLSCKKDWLDKKPNISLVVPQSLTDFQALLDNTLNSFNSGNCVLGEIGSDDYYVTDNVYSTLIANSQNAYRWTLDGYSTGSAPGWASPYTQVYYSNVVLTGLTDFNVSASNVDDYNNVKGSALFYRSFAYYDMAQIFAKPYDPSSSQNDLGLPLRTIPNVVNDLPRASVASTYSFIINDLKHAVSLLPITPKFKTRPSKPAAYGLLARAYLSMGDYSNAYTYADSCLQLYNTLIRYSTFNPSSSVPIPKYNDEVLFFNICSDATFRPTNAIIDNDLYASYNENDLRKTIFFKKDAGGLPRLFGRYSANTTTALFDGLAVDEIYIIRAEANARLGRSNKAMDDLNTLLVTRWKPGSYTAMAAANQEDAIAIVLRERRKELCFRGLRWSDLRRLNKDEKYAKTLTRDLKGQTYTLKPNSNRYIFQIPALETNYNSEIIQNPL